MKKISKKLIIVLSVVTALVLLGGFYIYVKTVVYPKQVIIRSIETNYIDGKERTKIKLSKTLFDGDVSCAITDKKNDKKEYKKAVNKTCTYAIEPVDKYIHVKNKNGNKKTYKLSDYINKILKFEIKEKEIYIAKGEEYKLNFDIVVLDNEKLMPEFSSCDEKIVTIDKDGKIKGIVKGDSCIKAYYNSKETKVKVHVNNLTTYPHIDNTRPKLSCGRYTNDEAKELDKILDGMVKMKGEKTRAGVVEAARFLSLKFPYRVGYFLENGRTTESSMPAKVDGEGRFYHKGLYLSKDKYSLLKYTRTGPAIWGCPIVNLNFGESRPNGLDCSGFVSWSILNGGYDIGDYGSAGYQDDGIPDLTIFGETVPITKELLTSGKVKAGDLVSLAGHIAIVVGIDGSHIYIAEELWYSLGLQVLIFTYDELVRSRDLFTHIVLMDSYYKNSGIYTPMWN